MNYKGKVISGDKHGEDNIHEREHLDVKVRSQRAINISLTNELESRRDGLAQVDKQ